jgi:hypothetical protein
MKLTPEDRVRINKCAYKRFQGVLPDVEPL